MTPARIAELLEPFLKTPQNEIELLSPQQLEHISTYIDILLRWNARINLTAIRDPEQIVTRHFGESLFAARHLFPPDSDVTKDDTVGMAREGELSEGTLHEGAIRGRAALQRRVKGQEQSGALAPDAQSRVADLGSGAGFPGIPLKLWAPAISLTLVESNHKKATFLREVTRALTLTDIDIQTNRAESLETTFDLVTLRAVERFETIFPVAANLIAPGGRLALLIGEAQLAQAQTALRELTWSPTLQVPLSSSRILATAVRES